MTTSADRLQLYEHARESWDESTARILMDLLPDDASELATHGDLRVLGSELRGEMAELRVEMSDRFAEQTRTLVLAMLGMVLTVITFSVGAVVLA